MKFVRSFLILVLALSIVSAQKSSVQKSPAAPESKTLDAARLLRDIEILSADDMEGREAGTAGGEKARAFVARRFAEVGIKPFKDGYLQAFKLGKRRAANVVGFIEGGKYKNRYAVVSAHYDHVGINEGEIFNGADDNASGVAALLALAEYFKKNKPEHTIIFAAFDAEEAGLVGARAFVAAPPVSIKNIALNINLDMVSRSEKNELFAAGTFHYPQLKKPVEKAARGSKIKLLFGHDRPEDGGDDWTTQSDHAAFHAVKIPFVYFGVENHRDYHRPSDDFARIDPEFFVRAVETILEAVKNLDKEIG
jgi:Zn-dependent M28 family amino/carboxypeptidase